MMFEIPTNEQWQKLFAVADLLYKKSLWQTVPEELIFSFSKGQEEEPFYATIHGFEEEAKGISIYADKAAIKKYLRIIDCGDDVTFQTIIANQCCVTVLYGKKNELGAGDFTAMEAAKFEVKDGNEGCIYFRRYQPGFSPWYIGAEDVELLIMGLTAINDIEIPPSPTDIENHMVLCEEQNGKFTASIAPFDATLRQSEPAVIKNDFYVAGLKRLKKTGRCIEIDIAHMQTPVGSNLGPIPFFPKLCIIADVDGGFIADQCIFEEIGDEEESFFSFLAKYFNENGLPRKINIRTNTIGYLLEDLCKRLHLELKEIPELIIIDGFLDMIGGMSPEE